MRKMTSGIWSEFVAVLLAEVFKEMLHRKKHCGQRGAPNLHQWPYLEKDTSPPMTAVPFVATRHSTRANPSVPSCEHRALFFKRYIWHTKLMGTCYYLCLWNSPLRITALSRLSDRTHALKESLMIWIMETGIHWSAVPSWKSFGFLLVLNAKPSLPDQSHMSKKTQCPSPPNRPWLCAPCNNDRFSLMPTCVDPSIITYNYTVLLI